METYLKRFMRELLNHKEDLGDYINNLYEDELKREDLNALFGVLKEEGLINCFYADNRAYEVRLTIKGKNMNAAELKLSDKEELKALIGCIESVEKWFHQGDKEWNRSEQIHDVPEYQEWLQQIIMYLQEILDRTQDQFIRDTVDVCKKKMNGVNDRRLFNEIVAKLKSIEINIDKYYQENMQDEEKMRNTNKKPKIFISHSSKDIKYVELIVDLLKSMGFNQDKVFCSSIPGYGIHLNEDIFDTLRDLFIHNNLYVIFVHSPNYYGSAVSLNEMGAAWVLKTSFCSFLLPGFNYSDMKGVVNDNRIAIKIDGDRNNVQNLLNELYEDLARFFAIDRDTTVVWERARNEFIDKVKATKVNADTSLSKEAADILKEAYKDDKGLVLIIRHLGGISIQAGPTIMNQGNKHREIVSMEAALKELIRKGYVSQSGADMYQITELGYQYLDT